MPRILYIEDDETLAQLVKRRLARQDFNIELSPNGQSGLSMLQQSDYDALIVDYQLPDMSGLDVLRWIVENAISVPVIMVSGQDNIRVAVEALNLGCQDYLIKDGTGYFELLPLHLNVVIEHRKLELQKRQADLDIAEAQDSLARAQGLAHIGNWEWRTGNEHAWWSEEEYRIFGVEKNVDVHGVPASQYLDRIHPDDREFVVKTITDKCSEFEYRIQRSDGSVRWIHAKNEVEFDADGQVSRCFGIDQDITERKLSEKRLLLAQQVFNTTTEGIMVADVDLKIISVNPAFTKITGYEEEDVIGKPSNILKSGKHDRLFYQQMWHDLTTKNSWAGEIWNRNKNGEIYPSWLSIALMRDEQGKVEQYVSVCSDITKHKEAEKLIEFQANYDALTKLPNRNLFNDRLALALAVAQRDKRCLALLFLDLDKFKWVNDTFGHRAGDALLQEVANRLTSVLRESDSVSRMGGDEFTIILNDLEQGLDAEIIAEKILAQLAEPFFLDSNELVITGSIGITIYPDDGKDIETLYRHADDAMYAAKEAGRNQSSFFTATMQHEAETRLALLTELRLAIVNNEFELYYQPVIDVINHSIYGAEALIRWHHPTRGLVMPMSFIPLAEETGLIRAIGQWVLEAALTQIKTWQDQGYNLHVAINKSSKQFYTDDCADDLHQTLDDYGIIPKSLTIEITETVLMNENERVMTLLQNYRKAGIQISLDDFGKGYSSLSYLRKYPFDLLKIDRSFVMDITDDDDDAALVEAIILMGHKLGLKVVAEGVETKAQLEFLKQHNCDMIQGYLYSPPIPATEFEQRFLIDQKWKEND